MSDITSCPAGLCHLRPHLVQHFTHSLLVSFLLTPFLPSMESTMESKVTSASACQHPRCVSSWYDVWGAQMPCWRAQDRSLVFLTGQHALHVPVLKCMKAVLRLLSFPPWKTQLGWWQMTRLLPQGKSTFSALHCDPRGALQRDPFILQVTALFLPVLLTCFSRGSLIRSFAVQKKVRL